MPRWYLRCMNLLSSTSTVQPGLPICTGGMIQQTSTANVADVLLPFNHGCPRHPRVSLDLPRLPVGTINQLHRRQTSGFKKSQHLLSSDICISGTTRQNHWQNLPLYETAVTSECHSYHSELHRGWAHIELTNEAHYPRSRMLTSNNGKSTAGNTTSTVEVHARRGTHVLWTSVFWLACDIWQMTDSRLITRVTLKVSLPLYHASWYFNAALLTIAAFSIEFL